MNTMYIIICLFLLILAYVAYKSFKSIKTYQDYNLAGRKTGLFVLTGTLVAAEFNTGTLIGAASVAYLFGLVGVWYTSLIFIPVFLIYALTVAKKYRRLNISTMAEFFDKRFGGKLAEPTRALATLITLSFTWLVPAAYLAGISVIGNVMLGVDTVTMAIVVTSICFILSLTGGLITAIRSDIIAFVMILIFIPILFIIGWHAAGGFGSLSQVFEPKFLSLKPVWDIDTFHFGVVLTWGFQVTLLYIAAPWYGQRIFSAKNDKIAYNGMLINTVLLAFLYGLVALATMFSRVLMPNLENAEQALPMLILNYAPPILQGLLLVTLLLVGTSTIIAVWNSAVSIVINDLFKRYFVKNKSERYYINASRVAFVVIGITTMLNALSFVGNILESVIYLQVFTCMLAFPILAGMYWKRFNTKAAMFSMLAGIIYCTYAVANDFPSYLISPIGVAVSMIVGVVIALVTKQDTPKGIIDAFYRKVNSSLDSNESAENTGHIKEDLAENK